MSLESGGAVSLAVSEDPGLRPLADLCNCHLQIVGKFTVLEVGLLYTWRRQNVRFRKLSAKVDVLLADL
jgi:hypothetical protein